MCKCRELKLLSHYLAGWRPSYKYYNTWTSLAGALLCAAVMFVTSWWTALITVAIIYGIYRYIAFTKPREFVVSIDNVHIMYT